MFFFPQINKNSPFPPGVRARWATIWCQGLQQGITDFTGKAKVHHQRTWISWMVQKMMDISTGFIGQMCEHRMNIIQGFEETLMVISHVLCVEKRFSNDSVPVPQMTLTKTVRLQFLKHRAFRNT